MRLKTDFPCPIHEISNIWIPMSDGCRLGARIWLPEEAERNPVPAIVEYIPYRKNDVTAPIDAIRHPYFAGHGYASIRIDMRGSGDSDGLMLDEYLLQEQNDAVEALAWIGRQPWCTGSVGLLGISWGGFNARQIAARRPPELKAIITHCSTDDCYADDVHYRGGCVLDYNIIWAGVMLMFRPAWQRIVKHDITRGLFETMSKGGRGFRLLQTGIEYITDTCLTHTIIAGDPLSAAIRYNYTISIRRGDWQTRVETMSFMSSDAETYRVTQTLDAYEGNRRIFAKSWTLETPRDLN